MKDAQAQNPTSTTNQSLSDPNATATNESKSTVPERYEFNAPEGKSLDSAVVERFSPIFKELGLDQASAQKLVDKYIEHFEGYTKAVNDMRTEWKTQVNHEQGGRLEATLADIGRMKDVIFANDDAGRKAFDEAMNLTGAGDHPAIFKAFAKASEAFREGTHVSGGGPSLHGQVQTPPTRPSAAQAMYPNLASSNAA